MPFAEIPYFSFLIKSIMNKAIVVLFFATSFSIACNKKMVPAATKQETKTGNTAKETPAKEDVKPSEPEKKEPAKVADAVPAQTSPPVAPAPLIPNKPSQEESGKNIYTSKCSKCHAAKNIGAYTYDQWEGILKSMIPKAKLTADEENLVVAYIRSHVKN
jgi:mono/diheme cytochrome c family protein